MAISCLWVIPLGENGSGLVTVGAERMSFVEISYGSGAVCFLVWLCFLLLLFYLFKLILKSRISQKYSAANIFVCMRLPWQLLGLWQMSQDWDFCFPKHLCCFSWSFLESLGNEVRGFNSSSEAVCAAQCLCLDQGVILVRGKEMKQCSKSALVLSSFHTLYPSLQGISQSVGLCFVFYFILKTILC